jgi:hypothetical protein
MTSLSTILRKLAANAAGLSDKHLDLLNKVAPKLVLRIRDSVEAKEDNPLSSLTEEEKKLLLAFVVYKRQNITIGPTDKPNSEDAAKIMNDELYTDLSNKDKSKKILKELTEQLNKAGLKVPMPKEVKDVKKNKGE